jgi:hypothetical protein
LFPASRWTALEETTLSSIGSRNRDERPTLRQAALIAGLGYILMPVSFAELYIYPKLVIRGNIEQTVHNIVADGRLFVVAILCYLITLILDVVIAWALYILLVPVNRSVSLLTAWFRLVYTVIALVGLLNLTTVYRMLNSPDYASAFEPRQLHAQVMLLLNSYRYDWSVSLMIFGIHLGLLGYLIWRSGYIPKIIGVLLVIDGLGWVIQPLRPYLYPNSQLGLILVRSFTTISFSELILPLWLLVRGWKIQEPESIPHEIAPDPSR